MYCSYLECVFNTVRDKNVLQSILFRLGVWIAEQSSMSPISISFQFVCVHIDQESCACLQNEINVNPLT